MADNPSQSGKKERAGNNFYKKPRKKYDSTHVLKKRVPPKDFKNPNDIYVTNKSNFKGQLKQCEELISKGEAEIFVHGLGAAIRRTINLALQIEEKYCGMYRLDVQTATVKLVDDFHPLTDEEEFETGTRMNSAVHIRIFKSEEK